MENVRVSRLFVLLVLVLHFNCCAAYDWGDFHKFAVIFFSFLGTFVGLGAIFTVIYFACFRSFLDRFKDEVAETHRLHHPWPIGSARWHLQRWSRGANTSIVVFGRREVSSNGKMNELDYRQQFQSGSLARAPQLQSVQSTNPPMQTEFPVYQTAERIKTPSIIVDRPTYYTPSGLQSPGKVEHIEEYRLVREESTLSQTSGGKPIETGSKTEDRIVRTTTTEHKQQTLRPGTYI
ncbi:hypothetical protein M3Y94_00274900 [Aphelenchoides besseyi]|nr:hypothetical protein M3Y94_00274900 [Aphelenchoides besseyi]